MRGGAVMASKLEERRDTLAIRRMHAEVGMRTAIADLTFNPNNSAARKRMAQLCAAWCSADQELHEVEASIAVIAGKERAA